MSSRTKIGVAAIALLLVLGLVVGYQVLKPTKQDQDTTGEVQRTTAVGTSSAAPTPTATGSTVPSAKQSVSPRQSGKKPTAKTVPGDCSPTLKEMNDPKRLTIERMNVTSPMLSLGEDESGAAAAPPKNASRTTGWWRNGPKVGSSAGHAVLTIHTYRNGGALGNELYEQGSGLKAGDIVKIADDEGNVQCYKMERTTKLWVKDYDPNSDVLYKFDGSPEAVIVICWDFDWNKEEWDSRILFHLVPLAS